MKWKCVTLLVLIAMIWMNKILAQLPLDTSAYSHPVITVTNPHFITSWAQFGQFDTSVVAAGTNLGGAYIKMQGTPTHHKVLINQGGTVFMNGLEIDDCAYLDFIGWGSSDPYGFIVDASNNGFAIPIEGKAHDMTFIGMNITGGTQEGFTAKIESADFSSKYLCDTSYAYYVQHNIRISNCKVRNNGGEAAYMNSTGWFGRDPVNGNAPFLGCPLNNSGTFDHNDVADTIKNTGTVTNTIFLDPVYTNIKQTIVFSGVVTKISGTISGNIIFSGSNNGSTFTALKTQTLTNATNTYTDTLPTVAFLYYRIQVVTSGTMLATIRNYTKFYYNPPPSDTILVDSNVFISPGRSAVNFSDIAHAYFRGNKGWHIGRELNTAQGRLLACGGKVGYLGDTIYVTGNKCFGSFNNNYWFASEGYLNFANNYGDSAGYWGTTQNSQPTESTLFGVTTTPPWNADSVTWRICNNQAFVNTSSPSTQFNLAPGPQNTNRNVVGGNNGNTNIKGTLIYSTNCGAIQNQPPVCNPGANATIQLPVNSYFFSQASASDPDGTIASILWTKVTGGTATFNNATILQPTVSNLVAGTYVFNMMVTDNLGATANKNITITVLPAANQPPNVNAGQDIFLTLPTNSVQITTASANDPDGSISSLAWAQISGTAAVISNATIINPTISSLSQGISKFKLTATDNGTPPLSNSDTMQITVNHALNKPPTCFAGNNAVITLPTNSYTFSDATASDPDGTIVSYLWSEISGGAATINPRNILNATVTNLVATTYIFGLSVTDDSGAVANCNVTLVVNNQPNIPPICNAGQDTTLILPTNSYQAHATASDPDGSIVSQHWVQFKGVNPATISNANILNPLISNLQADVYGFSLTVTDNFGATFTDTIFITVLPIPNQPPVCNAGGNVIITLPVDSFQVAATASDPDGFITSYAWAKLSGGTATISNVSILNPLISNLVQGTYQFKLTVTDNSGATATSVLTITVNHALNIPPSVNAGNNGNITLPTNTFQVIGATATDQDGIIISTVWTKLSGGTYTISNPNSLNPLFSNLVQGTYQFILTATDDSGAVGRDTLEIIVNHARNLPPVVNAGNDTTIQLPATTVNLIGTATDESAIVSTLWANTDGCSITNPNILITTATCSTSGTHIFTLSATDDSSVTSFDNKQVIVLPAINFPPVAIASSDTTVYKPLDSLQLTQSGTQTGGTIIAYLTTIYSSKFAPFVANPTTTTPTVHGFSAGDTIKVLLRVTNNNNIYGYDTTTIIVLADTTNHPPVPVIVRIPQNTLRLPTATVILDASKSYDNDPGDYIASYVWIQTSGNTVSLSGTSGSILTISNLNVGVYSFLLTITDSKGAQAQKSVVLTVYPAVRVKVGKTKVRQ